MALVRVNPPGQPVRYIDLGIARGRVSVARGAPIGGPLQEQASAWAGKRIRQEAEDRPRVKGARCLVVMRTGGTCMSMAGHSDHHRARP